MNIWNKNIQLTSDRTIGKSMEVNDRRKFKPLFVVGNGSEQTYPRRRVFFQEVWAVTTICPLTILGSVLARQFSCCSCTLLVKRRPQPLEHRMNEPYSPTTPRPISTSSPSTMKMFMGFLSVFIIAQFIGTVLFCLYLHMKLDKVELEINLHEDYLFLRKIQKCRKPEGAGSSFLDCKEIINRLEDLLIKDVNVNKDGAKSEMQKDDRQQPISAHLTGFKNSTKSVSVLQWQKTGYAPMNKLISYEGGKLKVEKEGLYYIYTQVSFCTKSSPGAPFTVFVYLNLPSESDRLLLKGQDTHSSSRVYCALQSSHLGGVFELRQGDVVFVNVTDSTQVNYDPGNTYFGMFKLF